MKVKSGKKKVNEIEQLGTAGLRLQVCEISASFQPDYGSRDKWLDNGWRRIFGTSAG